METEQELHSWRVLEFYSGIGGMRYSLIEAAVEATVVEAFDINDIANDVYQHNFGHRPYQGNIQTLTAADLDSYAADAWLLSPPCQPYTRQGHQKGSTDVRAISFLKILELIPQTSCPPLMLFVENVVGFEESDTHEKMVRILEENHFVTQEFILSPVQFLVPYSRPRYFCLAKRKPSSFTKPQFNHQLLKVPYPLLSEDGNTISNQNEERQGYYGKLLQACQPIQSFLELNIYGNNANTETGLLRSNTSGITEEADDLLSSNVSSDLFVVPSTLIERWGNAMDIVYPESRRCCCFTKSYYRYVKGTGSLLATVQGSAEDKKSSLEKLHLRYFTPREVANLHSFPADFQFPQHISLRQQYAMLGNSLSVAVVAPLLRYLFSHHHDT